MRTVDRKFSIFEFAAVVMLLCGAACSPKAQANGRYFFGEDKFESPIIISESIASAVRSDKNFADCTAGPDDLTTDSFEATEMDLNGDGVAEVVVKGKCGNSASSYFYWVLAKHKQSYEPILFHAAMGFEIFNEDSNGWPNIEFSGCNANTCFYSDLVFDGKGYVVSRSFEKSVNVP